MKVKAPIKIHNKFVIEVKDVFKDEIVQKGYAENIVLNNYFTASTIVSDFSSDYFGYSIAFGRGTGTLSPSRTTLFNRIASLQSSQVEKVINQPPLASYATKKIVLSPSSYVGETITEVGIAGSTSSNTIYTHALIKDSEGNPLVLEPKTDIQEITIYATVYFQPVFESGITLSVRNNKNALVDGFTGWSTTELKGSGANTMPSIFTNTSSSSVGLSAKFGNMGIGRFTITGTKRIETSLGNGKIKTIELKPNSTTSYDGNVLVFNIETMAENNSTVWSGWEFDKTPVGAGDGSQTIFNLTWDETWLAKPKKVYIDGVEVTTGFTFNAGNITFDSPPSNGAVITADYWVKYIPKDTNHVVDLNIEIIYGEGSAA